MEYIILILGLVLLFLPDIIFKIVGVFRKDYEVSQINLLMIRLIGFVFVLIILALYLYKSIF